MNIFHSILYIFISIQICECSLLTSSWGTRANYSETYCDFFLGFFFQSDRPTQYQETHSTVNEEKKGSGLWMKTFWEHGQAMVSTPFGHSLLQAFWLWSVAASLFFPSPGSERLEQATLGIAKLLTQNSRSVCFCCCWRFCCFLLMMLLFFYFRVFLFFYCDV